GAMVRTRKRVPPTRPGEPSAPDFGLPLDQCRGRRPSTLSLDGVPQRFSSTPYLVDVFREHPEYRYFTPCPLWLSVQRQRSLQGGQRELVGAHCPRQRIPATRGDRVAGAEQDPRLRTAQQFVAREGDGVDPARRRFGHGGLAAESPGREVHQEPATEVVQARGAPP